MVGISPQTATLVAPADSEVDIYIYLHALINSIVYMLFTFNPIHYVLHSRDILTVTWALHGIILYSEWGHNVFGKYSEPVYIAVILNTLLTAIIGTCYWVPKMVIPESCTLM